MLKFDVGLLKFSVSVWDKKATAFCQVLVDALLISGFWLLLSSCTYRFTNQYVTTPVGVRSIAVEAIYDTSREVLPHELLWQSLQRAFASDGHLRVVSQSQADALVRAHIKQASILADGGNLENDLNSQLVVKIKDPPAFSNSPPPLPSDFRAMTQAGEFRDKGSLSTVVVVEVWNLNTHKLILRKQYPGGAGFQAVHAAVASTSTFNDHLRYDEASRAAFKRMADSIATTVVNTVIAR